MEKPFAVIYFPTEDIFSEVPSTWLTPKKTHCWWPNTINPRRLMKKPSMPDEDKWVLHEIRIETYASTLESARKKAETPQYITGGEEVVFKKRETKKPNYSSSEDSGEITPPPQPCQQKKKKTSKKTISNVQFIASNDDVSLEFIDQMTNVHPQKPDTTALVTACTAKECDEVQELKLAVEKLSVICNNIQKYVTSIDERLKDMMIQQGGAAVDNVFEWLESSLPLKSEEEIRNFEKFIAESPTGKSTYVQYLKRIGGKDYKDHVNRTLQKLFTNELGTKCSYVGLRGNFKLQGFKFMMIYIDVVLLQNTCAQHAVEKAISEWFRLAYQRQKRNVLKEINKE